MGDFRKHLLEERGRSLECRNSMNQSTKVEIYLKHISRNVNNVGDKHRKVDGRQTVEGREKQTKESSFGVSEPLETWEKMSAAVKTCFKSNLSGLEEGSE